MTHPLKIGVVLRFKNPEPWKIEWAELYRQHLSYAAAVDRLGFDGIWLAEHHCLPSGYNPAPFVALAAIAGVTERCRIGTQPLLLPLYNPVLAAEQAAAVDVLSGGRLILCVGAGYRDGDFDAVGIPRSERGARSEEGLGVLLRALRGESFDHEGRFFTLKGVSLAPPPIQQNVPVQLAARSSAAAKRAIRHHVDVNVHAAETATELAHVFQEEAARAGRAIGDIGVSIQKTGFLAASRAEAVAASKEYLIWQAREFLGNTGDDATEVEVAERMIATIEAGVGPYTVSEWVEQVERDTTMIAATGMRPDWVNITLWHSGMPLGQALEALECFAADVLPRLRTGRSNLTS